MGTTNPAGQDITALEQEHRSVHARGIHPSYGTPPSVSHPGAGPDRPAPVDHVEASRRVREAQLRGT